MIDLQNYKNVDELESQLYFNWIDDLELKNQLTIRVKAAKDKRTKSQDYISKILNISLTKIKEIENGSCKDINAINNYINFMGENLLFI